MSDMKNYQTCKEVEKIKQKLTSNNYTGDRTSS